MQAQHYTNTPWLYRAIEDQKDLIAAIEDNGEIIIGELKKEKSKLYRLLGNPRTKEAAMPEPTAHQIDAGSEALRQHEQGGKILRSWESLPNGDKKKWRVKAQLVLRAATDAKLAK